MAESGSGHAVVVDGAPEAGGRNIGMRPMELLLAGRRRLHRLRRRLDPARRRASRSPTASSRRRRSVRRRSPRCSRASTCVYTVAGRGLDRASGRARGQAVEGEVLLGDDHARQDRRDHLRRRHRRRRSRSPHPAWPLRRPASTAGCGASRIGRGRPAAAAASRGTVTATSASAVTRLPARVPELRASRAPASPLATVARARRRDAGGCR